LSVAASLRELVRRRADDRCEYCGIGQQSDPFFTFHVEHIVARQHGGATVDSNLALSCHHCNLHKGPNLTGIDPLTGAVVQLYNPRTAQWAEHFALRQGTVEGLTPVGRATAALLEMNSPLRVRLRAGPKQDGAHDA
jgi:hypothetical protein